MGRGSLSETKAEQLTELMTGVNVQVQETETQQSKKYTMG